ncbi:hypothetical protein TW86_03915 [Halomonas sp. S2151]|uniref:hypothetical protein n=1 Tax=Halomonas sp. S2151 TaxID=579478 RepID=UPI0005F9ADD9|nr:hypothetical protein [Halomonas sp. S2151]KJZ17409.1 hypothetical protein TW86_03915 [Halomonas sp. S2151]
MKVKIAEPALANYTGILYRIQFLNGESLRELTPAEVSMIGAAMRVTDLEGNQVGAAVNHGRRNAMTVSKATEVNSKQEAEALSDASPAGKAAPATKTYTADELAAIADEQGISGLREIADPLGIKGRSINELIREITEYQGA